ncbi:MAG: glycosyltransferase family 39 protein [Thermoanaerobaculia bacterium]
MRGAAGLAQTGTYPDRTDYYFFRAPAYPAFLALVTFGHPDRIALAKVAGAAAASLTPLFTAALAARLFRRRGVALAAGFAATLDPSLVYLSTDIQSEVIFVPLLLAAGVSLLAALDRPSTSLALGAGLLLAGAALARPSALALSPLLLAPLFDRRWPVRARAHLAGAAALGLVLGLAPWTARNALRFHELILVSDSAGATSYDGNSIWTPRLYDARSREELGQLVAAMEEHKRAHVAALPPDVAASPSARSRSFLRLSLAELAADRAAALRLYTRKIWEWLRPYPSPVYWPAPVVISVGIYDVILYALAAAGMVTAARRGAVLFSLLYLALTMLTHMAFLVVWRHRVPYWNPVLLVYAAALAGDTLARWRKRSREGRALGLG